MHFECIWLEISRQFLEGLKVQVSYLKTKDFSFNDTHYFIFHIQQASLFLLFASTFFLLFFMDRIHADTLRN